MTPRITELIRTLGLRPHPEGGYFVETFRSPSLVSPSDARTQRSALTIIYFLLVQGSFSRWHHVRSDEAWHWHEGSPLELLTVPPEGGVVTKATLAPLSADTTPVHVIPANYWQAARALGPYTLAACCVAPGFDFSDFTLLASVPQSERPFLNPLSALDELL